ncbi:MAG: DNA translocase FtsK, partial [Planctomycetota bacterium]|nr:DNA translocase FtsK [Planctomycetota bacterium]
EAAELEEDEELVAELDDEDDDDEAEAAELEEDEELEEDLPDVELQPTAKVAPKAEPQAAPEPKETVVELTREELVYRCGSIFLEEGRVAVSILQRRFDMSFKEATSILDDLQNMGLIGPYMGGSRRDILLTSEEWEELASAV